MVLWCLQYKCCGANLFEDWKYSHWQKENLSEGLKVPNSCCKTITPRCGKSDHPSNIHYTVSLCTSLHLLVIFFLFVTHIFHLSCVLSCFPTVFLLILLVSSLFSFSYSVHNHHHIYFFSSSIFCILFVSHYSQSPFDSFIPFFPFLSFYHSSPNYFILTPPTVYSSARPATTAHPFIMSNDGLSLCAQYGALRQSYINAKAISLHVIDPSFLLYTFDCSNMMCTSKYILQTIQL